MMTSVRLYAILLSVYAQRCINEIRMNSGAQMSKESKKMKNTLRLYMIWPMVAGAFFLLVTAGLFAINLTAGVFSAIALLVYAIATAVFITVRHRHLTKDMIDFASGYAQMQRRMLDHFVVPYLLLDEKGKIVWLNERFKALFEEDVYHKELKDLFSEMLDLDIRSVAHEQYEITYKDCSYNLLIEKMDLDGVSSDASMVVAGDSANLYAVYLFDITELNTCKRELHDERFVCGLIYIDNYDEALESIDEGKRPMLTALIDRRINRWISTDNGIIKKLEKDKYLIAIRYKFLEKMRDERFSILEDIKGASIGNDVKVTLSIGIGAMGSTFLRNYETARAAIDLALGRGGDQAVVREGNKVTYYGGKTNTMEKATRVKARVKAHALRELLEATDNVLIMGHKISDVDAVGAAIGLYAASRVFGKKANIVLNDVTTSMQPIVDGFNESSEYDKDLFVKSEDALKLVNTNTLLIIVDTNKANYTECPELIGRCKNTVVLDHHRQTSDPVENATLSYIEPYASSACEMVAEVLQYIADGLKIRPMEADTMYAGIVIDTNNFTNKAGARTFEAAAFLRRNGADIIRVRKILRSDMIEYKAKAEAVRHAEVYREAYALSVCPSAGLQSPTIVGAQAANELLNINGMKASFVFTYYNDEIYISARSIDEVNVQLIMERLGGGGHMTIAGAQLKEMDMEDAINLVKTTLDEMLEEGVIS